MKITEIDVYPLNLPMKQNFRISGGSVGDTEKGAPHVYIKITTDDRSQGWGEARPSNRWSYETIESVVSTINHYFKPILLGQNAEDIKNVHKLMNSEIKNGLTIGQPIAKAGIDTALHDLIGKHQKKTISELWFSKPKRSIGLSYLISTRNIQEAVQKANYAFENGYQGIDLKIGFSAGEDLGMVEAVKEAAPDLFFRVDANQGYTLSEAVKVSKGLEKLGVDVFEQPLKANDLLGHAELRRKTYVPIALDESIWTAGDLIQAIRLEACDTAVIKITKMGGLSGAKLCGEIAREANLGLLGGGLTESTLGLTASAHVFNYLEIDRPVDLNGPMFLEDDPVGEGPAIDEGNVLLNNDLHGVGCSIDTQKINKFRVG
ncbi:mandelate racemase/muconate lactonizing enzyme family protein [Pseudalkalibacillus salsuginis]|uniref:mandelate racemase/muconate lactonizing enzyme family protein n=1 Tax=Pseudalkalibacillus salsuginis TaxID=2910972 RepID=UPI001F3616E9|nr:enolase C-terminal domain-like protein [Pseudalkalibacillus salsuginis]MCF6411622.1 mandelate racemase [Pseudalkalibacillus salsuginis]